METEQTPVVLRFLRSGVKVVEQSGRVVTLPTSPTSSPQVQVKSQVKSQGKKSNKSAALSTGLKRDRKLNTSQDSLEDSPGQFKFGVRFTKKSSFSESSGWAFNYRYKRLYVDLNSWVPALCSFENSRARSGTEFQVRVRAVMEGEDLTFSSSSSSLPFHLIRLAEASPASYQQDSQGRYSVIFPVSNPAATCRKIKFTRLSSHLGREVKVVFSLEDGEGQEVGRRVFTVKIRAESQNV